MKPGAYQQVLRSRARCGKGVLPNRFRFMHQTPPRIRGTGANRWRPILAEAGMHAVLELSPQPCIALTTQGDRILAANRAALQLLGYPSENIAGKPPETIGLTFDLSMLANRESADQFRGLQCTLQRSDQEQVDLIVNGRHQKVLGRRILMVSLMEVGGMKRLEQALRRARDDLQTIFMRSPQPFCITEYFSGRILQANEAWLRLYGYVFEDVVGRDDMDVGIWLNPADRDGALAQLDENGQLQCLETVHRHRDGASMDVLVSAQVTQLDGNDVRVWQLMDISQRKRYEHAIRRLNQELEQRVADRTHELQAANGELESFSYSVAHDLRAPLRAIDGYSSLLRDEQPDGLSEVSARYIDRIHGNVARMARLIDDLLACAQIGRRALDYGSVDMHQLAISVCEELSCEYPQAEIAIGVLPPVRGDPALLRQVLENLISNALKFTSTLSSPLVEIFAVTDIQSVTFHVRDNGVGFDMRYAERLFEVFERLHSEREYPGTGVGLAIVQRVIKRHRGRVWAESSPGAGAIFHFELPVLPEQV